MKYCKIRLLQFTTARLITNYNNVYYNLRSLGYYNSRQLAVITIYDRYYNLPRLLLQFTTGILQFTTEHVRTKCKQRRKRFTFNKLKGKNSHDDKTATRMPRLS